MENSKMPEYIFAKPKSENEMYPLGRWDDKPFTDSQQSLYIRSDIAHSDIDNNGEIVNKSTKKSKEAPITDFEQSFLLFKPEVKKFSEERKDWLCKLTDDLKIIKKFHVVLTEELLNDLHPNAVNHPKWPEYRDSIKNNEVEVWVVRKNYDRPYLATGIWGIYSVYSVADRIASNSRYVMAGEKSIDEDKLFQKVILSPRIDVEFYEQLGVIMRHKHNQYLEKCLGKSNS